MQYVQSEKPRLLSASLLVFLAVCFPPAVAMLRGTTKQMTLALILTLLAWVPGVLFALWLLTQPCVPVASRVERTS